MRVADVMMGPVEIVAPEELAEAAWDRMRERGIHHLVVVDEGAVVGVISDADLGGPRGAALRRDRAVRDLMSRKVVTVAPGTPVRRLARQLRGHSIGCVPVLDREWLVGIVTFSDLLALVASGQLVEPGAKPRMPSGRRIRGRPRAGAAAPAPPTPPIESPEPHERGCPDPISEPRDDVLDFGPRTMPSHEHLEPNQPEPTSVP